MIGEVCGDEMKSKMSQENARGDGSSEVENVPAGSLYLNDVNTNRNRTRGSEN
jgi:hypothetical protein